MLDLKLLRGHQTEDKMTVGEPLCKFVNVQLCGGAQSLTGTVLLENPQGTPVISLDQLTRQVHFMFYLSFKLTSCKRTRFHCRQTISDGPLERLNREDLRNSPAAPTTCNELAVQVNISCKNCVADYVRKDDFVCTKPAHPLTCASRGGRGRRLI